MTVCLPMIGRPTYFAEVFRCLEAQTYPRIEVLVLDNASPPETLPLLEAIVADHPFVRTLRCETRVPVFANFNRGVRAARGKYIAFFHDDDRYHPHFLEKYVSLLEGNPAAVFAGGNFSIMDADGRITRQHSRIKKTGYWSGRDFITDLVRRGRCALPTPGLLFRRDLLAIEGFDESLPGNWGDFPIFMRLAERGEVAVSKEVYFTWRIHGHNGSNIPFSRAIPERTRLFSEYVEEYRARHPGGSQFAARLTRANRRNHWLGLLWGWFAASDPADAEACRLLLRDEVGPLPLSPGLKLLERLGLSLERRRSAALGLRNLSQPVRL